MSAAEVTAEAWAAMIRSQTALNLDHMRHFLELEARYREAGASDAYLPQVAAAHALAGALIWTEIGRHLGVLPAR